MYFSLNNKGYLGLGSDTVFYNHYLSDVWELSIDPSSVHPEPVGTGLEIYPNPAGNSIKFKFDGNLKMMPHDRISYFDSNGRCIETNVVTSPGAYLQKEISHFPKGMMFVKIGRNNELVCATSFLKL